MQEEKEDQTDFGFISFTFPVHGRTCRKRNSCWRRCTSSIRKACERHKKVVTEGPYATGNEMAGGYLIVNAKDKNDAVEISKGCPVLNEDGSVEVRPIQKRN